MDGIFIDEQLYDVEQALLTSGLDASVLENGGDVRVDVSGNGGVNGGGVNGEAQGAAGGVDGGVRPQQRVSSAGTAGPSRTVRVATDAV